jgi:hypothetical protein
MTVSPASRRHVVSSIVSDVVALPATLGRFAVQAVRWMIIAPVTHGRLRLGSHSAGVRTLAVVSIALSGVLVAMVPLASSIRSASDLTVVVTGGTVLSVPRGVIWVFVLALCLFIAMLQAAAMHAALWFRLLTLFVVSLMLAFVGSIDSQGGMTPGVWVAVGAVAAMVLLEVVRWPRPPAWWEPLVVLAIMVTVFAVVYLRTADVAQSFGIDRAPLLTASLVGQFRLLAVPLAIFAGVAVARVALSGVTLVSDFSARRFSPVTFAVITALVVGWRVVSLTMAWIDDLGTDGALALRRLGGAGVSLGVVVGVWWLTHHLLDLADARAQRPDDDEAPVPRAATTVEGIVDRLDDVAIPASIALAVVVGPTFVAAVGGQVSRIILGEETWLTEWLDRVAEWVTTPDAVRSTRLVVAGGIIAVGLWLARQGRRGIAELSTVVGAVVLMQYLTDSRGVFRGWGFAPQIIDRFGVLAAAGAAVVWTIRRTFTTDRQSVVLLAVLVSSLLGQRDFISSPLTFLIGTSGIALVLFGLVWNFLTDADAASGDSPGFPGESRLLLFLSQTLFGLTVLAWVALSRDPASGLELNAGSALGDSLLGVALLILVYLTLFMGAARTSDLVETEVLAETVDL